ncbi:hypothetical protein IFM89_004922 [Coptis chinensis]|uniref:Uncharacterized protein n=1 Tax=Coptis chinensis TaxID=261450 RepID=A0A835HR17_9MAGN|nr:hypothetical protein IFM89_004922 [Coptis chinensis]
MDHNVIGVFCYNGGSLSIRIGLDSSINGVVQELHGKWPDLGLKCYNMCFNHDKKDNLIESDEELHSLRFALGAPEFRYGGDEGEDRTKEGVVESEDDEKTDSDDDDGNAKDDEEKEEEEDDDLKGHSDEVTTEVTDEVQQSKYVAEPFDGPSFDLRLTLSPPDKVEGKDVEGAEKPCSLVKRVKENKERKSKMIGEDFTGDGRKKRKKGDTGKQTLVDDSNVSPLFDPKTCRYYVGLEETHREVIDTFFKITDSGFGRQFDVIEELSNEMIENNIELDNITYSTIITCAKIYGKKKLNIYGSGGKVEKAVSMFEEMLRLRVKLNVMGCTCLIQCLGKAKRIEDVVRVSQGFLWTRSSTR